MSEQRKVRTGLQIISELLALTHKMAGSEDPDFLVPAIDKRELLMAEYDMLKSSSPRAAEEIKKNKPEITAMMNEMIKLDKQISKTLAVLRSNAKLELEGANISNKVLNYTNSAISASGSYMDYKK